MVELIEQKLDVELLRVPEDFERPIRSEVDRIVDEQAPVNDVSVCIAIWNRADEDCRVRIRSIA